MSVSAYVLLVFFFFQAEDGIRDGHVTGVQTCALPIYPGRFGLPHHDGGGPGVLRPRDRRDGRGGGDGRVPLRAPVSGGGAGDRKSTRLNSSHVAISYAVFCLKKKNNRARSRTQQTGSL